MDDLLQEFIAETRETLEAISGEIVAWEAAPADQGRLDGIFRFVHTVKGSCGFLDLPRLARLSHAAEDVLATVRDGKRTPDTALVNAVLGIVDRIGAIVEAIAAGASLDNSDEDLLIAALAPDAQPCAQAPAAPQNRVVSRSVRLNVDLLDHMMSGMSEMVLARNELARRLRDSDVDPQVEAALERLSLTVADMRDTVTRTRMQKVDALFSALPRLVRDTSAELAKSVDLVIEGADVELDREMIELMRDPLGHIIRNAIDHGIEIPAERRAAGKPMTGRLIVSARQSGNQILIEIADDGKGIDVARIVAKAAEKRLYGVAELALMSEAAKLDLIFAPGLSSRDTVTAISGRGVGMDVVRANIEQIGGRVVLTNDPGRGLRIVIHVPLTLSILSTIIVGVGSQRFALPRQAIEEIVMVRGDQVRIDTIGDAATVTVRGKRMPLVSLGHLLDLNSDAPPTLVIVSTREGDYALGVDTVLDTEELVVKPASPAVMATGVYAGKTLPDNGLPMLLLDAAGIAAVAGLRFTSVASVSAQVEEVVPGVPALLFDDLDGQRRAIALAVIDRVEPVPTDAIRWSGGAMRLSVGDTIIPLHAVAELGARIEVAVLRLTDGESEMAYAIAEAIEIVALPAEMAPARGTGPIAGVVSIAGEQIELVDPHALFAGQPVTLASLPVCLLQVDGSGWMETFLKPALEASGYRCVTALAAGETAAVALAMEDAPVRDTMAPVVTLRRTRTADHDDDASIYRYDRPALIAALAARRAM
ncbi:two-component system chemotaxis sensor kinase CheA [Sphingomonas sp. PP-F2F-A104-K0414]|uniref:chemotaxis protein CheA n=1 Tax=Sphingomonas sp. PP-F2F-A104-K0414 TaxID=2135661 RepID=UPI001042CAFE|nr:chemotaxis protein CheW [Sphingomonas sp. PP-F2F-A104-K0414]TCP98031.1 two-component system chemotaxis sensor kinase CheA [Sphingomonas sp. PP-F2F-A104-K0414]